MRFPMRQFKRPGQAVIASLLAGLVLLLNAMAASPSLHEWFHSDAGESGHQCAVTVFAHGQVDLHVVEVAAIIPMAPVEFCPRISASVFNAFLEPLPPGRGPPASLLPS